MVEQRQEIGYASPGWNEEDDITIVAPRDGVNSLVPVLLNTFAFSLVALAVFFR